jgi:hypothetical protein
MMQEPFRRYHETKRADTFTVRVNHEERERLENIKRLFELKSDSKALKMCGLVGYRCLISSFGRELLRYLFSSKRVRK